MEVVTSLFDGTLDLALAHERIAGFRRVVTVVPEMSVITDTTGEPSPEAEGEIVFLHVGQPVAIAVANEPMGHAERVRKRGNIGILQQFLPERRRRREGERVDRRGVAKRGIALREPAVDIHVCVLANRVIEVEKQALPLETLPAPCDLRPGEAAARAGNAVGGVELAGVRVPVAGPEGARDGVSVGVGDIDDGWIPRVFGGDEEGVAAHRYAGRIGEGAARHPRGAAVVPIRVADLPSVEDIRANEQMASFERWSPQGASVQGIAASLERPVMACPDLDAFMIALEHDVDGARDGVSPVQGGRAVAQDLDALDGRYRQGVEFEVQVSR